MDWLCNLLTDNPGLAGEMVKSIPSLLWFVFSCVVVIIFYRPIKHELLPHLGSLKAMGVELSFVKDSMDRALELAEKSPQWQVEVSSEDKKRVLDRVKRHLAILKGAHVLWVDDHPENNLNERKMFLGLDVGIDTAKSTEDALSMATGSAYDLVFSDIVRGDQRSAGIDFLQRFRSTNRNTPVIFYVGSYMSDKGVPGGAFGITNRPDELLHLTLDALERRK